MEFKSLKNIETSFRQIRLFCIVLVIGCAVVAICSVVFAFRFAEKQREKIYVLDGGKSLMLALSQDLSQNRPAEAREHVRRFHELFLQIVYGRSQSAFSASSSSSVALLLQYARWCLHSDLRRSNARRYTSLMEASR